MSNKKGSWLVLSNRLPLANKCRKFLIKRMIYHIIHGQYKKAKRIIIDFLPYFKLAPIEIFNTIQELFNTIYPIDKKQRIRIYRSFINNHYKPLYNYFILELGFFLLLQSNTNNDKNMNYNMIQQGYDHLYQYISQAPKNPLYHAYCGLLMYHICYKYYYEMRYIYSKNKEKSIIIKKDQRILRNKRKKAKKEYYLTKDKAIRHLIQALNIDLLLYNTLLILYRLITLGISKYEKHINHNKQEQSQLWSENEHELLIINESNHTYPSLLISNKKKKKISN